MSTLRETWDGWEWSQAPGAPLRGKDFALRFEDSSKSEIWSAHLSQRTLAKGNSLMEYIIRAKLVNEIELTEEETLWLNQRVTKR